MARKPWLPKVRQLILDRDNHKCVYCGNTTSGIDHVIPIYEGGLTIPANGVCCCKSCNSKKGTKLDESWIVKGLQRLIQHGENVNWIANIRHNNVEIEPKQQAVSILLNSGFNTQEIIESTGLTYNEVSGYIKLVGESECVE